MCVCQSVAVDGIADMAVDAKWLGLLLTALAGTELREVRSGRTVKLN